MAYRYNSIFITMNIFILDFLKIFHCLILIIPALSKTAKTRQFYSPPPFPLLNNGFMNDQTL